MNSENAGQPSFTIRVDHVGDVPVAVLGGDLDVVTVPLLDEAAAPLFNATTPGLVIDLAGVEFCGSAGLAWLMEARDNAMKLDFPLVLTGCRPMMLRLLELTGLLPLFDRRPDSADTVAGLLASR
ncbi:STAS domain-containing protein [Actinokineospora sp. PR83]|uniref:STAS domain-containing protein n=1 Tax=Actinokineospora sp. PR83 TaxID=2884908 RepID=UPI001F39F3F1|nr:STAS domain-containing protein [Actinokineospora sp. PR83]MCG8916424.1 STAS domain-containing protein [Actinokineospora sp. PR83]